MEYILVSIATLGEAYQELSYGQVTRYVSVDGVELFKEIPTGLSSTVINANPGKPSWFVEPPPPVPEPQPAPTPTTKDISKLDYMNRFTDAELGTIYSVAKTNVALEVWLEKFKLADFIDLNDPRTQGGLLMLEAAGLLGKGRATEIINA